jgi:hypothetical protein
MHQKLQPGDYSLWFILLMAGNVLQKKAVPPGKARAERRL